MKAKLLLLATLLGLAAPVAGAGTRAQCNASMARPAGSIRRRWAPTICVGRSCWSISGPTPASTGSARFPMCAPGPRSTKTRGWSSSACTAPEFEFEKNVENVQRAVRDMNIAYPVAIDSNYEIWRAFSNNAWPAVFLIDAQGRVRYRHLGEEEYEATERTVQQLLAEAGKGVARGDLVTPTGRGTEAAPDWASLKSPETYLGTERGENRVNSSAMRLRLNQWTASGDWTAKRQAILLNKPYGRIAYRFRARDLHLVMGPAAAGSTIRFRVLIDGKPPGAAHGSTSTRWAMAR